MEKGSSAKLFKIAGILQIKEKVNDCPHPNGLDVAWDQWEHRNVTLHNDWEADYLKRIPFINAEIKRELGLRSGDIPPPEAFLRQHEL